MFVHGYESFSRKALGKARSGYRMAPLREIGVRAYGRVESCCAQRIAFSQAGLRKRCPGVGLALDLLCVGEATGFTTSMSVRPRLQGPMDFEPVHAALEHPAEARQRVETPWAMRRGYNGVSSHGTGSAEPMFLR